MARHGIQEEAPPRVPEARARSRVCVCVRALRACGACERSRERDEERGAAQRSPRKAVTGAWQLADRSF